MAIQIEDIEQEYLDDEGIIELLPELRGGEIDNIFKLANFGPQETGDLPSKVGAYSMFHLGLVTQDANNVVELSIFGKTFYNAIKSDFWKTDKIKDNPDRVTDTNFKIPL